MVGRLPSGKYKPISIIKMLKDERERLCLSQEILSTKIGLGIGHLSNYENGHNKPNAATFVAWLEALDYEIVKKR